VIEKNQGPDLSAPHLWLVMMKAYRSAQAVALESIGSTGLGLSDFAVLEMLLHKGPMPVNAIGKKVSLTSGSMSTAADRLQERGLVRRRQDDRDRRVFHVALTAKGQRLIEKAFDGHAKDLEEVFVSLTKAEKESWLALHRKVGRMAESLTEARGA
jgi:MarR family 2-MHQ and catechol resistance regulon transcriptional repressor